MQKKLLSGRLGAAVLGAAMLLGSAVPATAFAANGVQSPAPSGYTYTTTDAAGTGAWDDADKGAQGQVDLTYDTTNGKWTDSQGVEHANGTYVVRIPKAVKYEGMNVGVVNISDDYDVTVEGVLAPGKSVDVKAETGKTLSGTNLLGNVTEVTSLKDTTAGGKAGAYAADNFHNFTAAQVSKMTGAKVTGTTVQDNIAISGTVLSAGTYVGNVQYTAALK
jgi:hypothetical protein